MKETILSEYKHDSCHNYRQPNPAITALKNERISCVSVEQFQVLYKDPGETLPNFTLICSLNFLTSPLEIVDCSQ